MLSLLSLSTRLLQAHTWTRTAQSLWVYGRAASSISHETTSTSQDAETDQESSLARLKREDRNAYARWRRHNDDDYRKRRLEVEMQYRRSPDGREKIKANLRKTQQAPARKLYRKESNAQRYQQSLFLRRAMWLNAFLRNGRWLKEGWTWKLHTPVKTPDRVDRHCTACDRDRFLKLWWATKAEPTTYVCSSCFANDFNLVVPEGQHDKLPAIFTSPDHPPPPKAS